MAWVDISTYTPDYGNINTNQVVRVSPVLTRSGATIKGGTEARTTYYFKIITSNEILESIDYNTSAEATTAQAAVVVLINV